MDNDKYNNAEDLLHDDNKSVRFRDILAELPGIDLERRGLRGNQPVEIERGKTGLEHWAEEALEVTHNDSLLTDPPNPGPIVNNSRSHSTDASG